ncbi:response regulator [Oceaniserpentilla sp. 4NH20-0058]|uniref:response regulator n=1 Tax=Oceaniserpentilla sp. 4NH20-0058 TaxID=3127660 RepID=UPI00310C23A0
MPLELKDLTVLLIEPSSTQSKYLLNVLSEQTIEKVDVCSTGLQALATAQKQQPDLIISTMYLDDMNAIELLKHLRQDEATQDLNFMLVSSETDMKMLDDIKQAGVLAVLPKPFDKRDLSTALNAARDTIEVDQIQLNDIDIDSLVGLIVDDSKTARRHVLKLLNACGIENTFEAENGLEAIEILKSETVDFIISDYNMPHMNGEELANYLRQSEYSYLPILMVTSEQDSSRLSAVRQAGVCALFDKTIGPASLKDALRAALNS